MVERVLVQVLKVPLHGAGRIAEIRTRTRCSSAQMPGTQGTRPLNGQDLSPKEAWKPLWNGTSLNYRSTARAPDLNCNPSEIWPRFCRRLFRHFDISTSSHPPRRM